ncbi:MAG: DUF4962 domain-containing protein [Planctomycetes bacterium]|nr:DUF4962 domain-containing protein [Planctomycetota bacterium]MBL7038642.1 DUF4962 domain-containing protein [Pirellulaceae bacterium]
MNIRKRHRLAGFVSAAIAYLAIFATMSTPCAESPLPVIAAIHPARRTAASPADGEVVTVNPPPLLWPVVSGADVRYEVRLSQAEDFSDATTIRTEDLRWAMFNPHRKLATGTWYWQYGMIRRSKPQPKWSPVRRFEVDDAARLSVTPSASEMIAAIPSKHPRILVSADKLALLRERVKNTDRLTASTRSADRLVRRPVRGVEAARPNKQGTNAFEAKNFAKWASKGYAAKLLAEVKSLTLAYLLTGDRRYGDAAVERGLATARLDPSGPTSRKVSDFADGSCMEAMALVYDCCYDQLDADERTQMRHAMIARAAPWFTGQMNNLESRVFSAHIWQHILQQATEVALALHGEVPEAEMWLAYVYELWQARVPLLGGEDGGWANGVNYFATNFKTLLEMPTLLERYTSKADFFSHPWYRNTIYYQIYAWPSGSASDGFGDGAERQGTPSTSRAMFLYFLGERFQDPAALWYARQIAGNQAPESFLTPMLWIERTLRDELTTLPKPVLPDDLPQARAFRDTGIVSMHTDLASPADNLMVAFRASPYGSYNHMHSDQNSFNLLFGGRRLFSGSGYYIGYGDEHFKGWYTHTRGHNSVLIDDRGQIRGADGYGRIARYINGRQISYCAGDASNAYGDAGLTRFRRHLVFLRPDTIVIYDDLLADHAAKWSWLLHSIQLISTSTDGRRLFAVADTGRAQVDLFASSELQVRISDQFDPPAVNWRDKTSGGKVIQYPNQWHVTAEPTERLTSARFLAVIQVANNNEAASLETPIRQADGVIRTSNWQITAALDPTLDASLLIQRADGKAALAVDCPEFTVGDAQYESAEPESVLIEDANGPVRRCQDNAMPPS